MATKDIRILCEGVTVVLVIEGRAIRLPYQAARLLGRGLLIKAAESELNDPPIVRELVKDQAVLIRAGVPIALTSRPDVLREAAKEARDDPALRRALPGIEVGMPQLGVPSIIQHSPGRR